MSDECNSCRMSSAFGIIKSLYENYRSEKLDDEITDKFLNGEITVKEFAEDIKKDIDDSNVIEMINFLVEELGPYSERKLPDVVKEEGR